MEKRKSHHPLEGGSRISAYTFDTNELTIITDPKDPLYDRRVEDPLKREFVLNIALRGVDTAINIRRRDTQNVVVRGKQRSKAVIVVNALAAGVPYTGPIRAVHAAIREFGADEDFVKKISLFVKKPLKLRALPANSGDERDARLGMRAENAHRHGDPLAMQIQFVQEEHEKYGTAIADLAANENVSEATIKRWLKMDPNARGPRKKRGKATRPGAKAIEALVEQIRVHMTPRESALLDWIRGKTNGKDIAEHFLGTAERRKAEETRV